MYPLAGKYDNRNGKLISRSPFFISLVFVCLFLWSACAPRQAAPPCSNPNARAAEVCIYSSDTKQDWLNALVTAFNAAKHTTQSGKPIQVYAFHVNSGTSQQDILSGKIRPTVWSPGDQSWVDGLNLAWRQQHGQAIVPDACQATVYAPVGFAMWRPMAEALGWPDDPISWDTLVALSADPEGWGRYGHPEWGAFKFGHTHPDHSNSGLLLLTALAYSTFDRTQGLTPEMVESQPFVDALRSVELNTYHYGLRSKDLLGLMLRRGPDYLHATNTSEADTLKLNREQADALRFPLAFIFPSEGTFWTEQPYCLLAAEWVSADQAEAARLFEAYLHEPAQQSLAVSYNLRPVDTSLPLGEPFTLANGTDPGITPETVPALASPSGAVSEAVKRVFHQTKKQATVLLVLDTSGSMRGAKIANARQALANFIGRLAPADEVSVILFNDSVRELQASAPAGEIGDSLRQSVLQQRAGGDTALHDAVCAAVQRVAAMQGQDGVDSERRLYGVVLLTDGLDTQSWNSREAMFGCLPTGEEVEGIKVFTIAYGSDADEQLLAEIAARTNGKAFTADPANIEQVYLAISAEQ
jgi:Ca-activated chloride channel family protein